MSGIKVTYTKGNIELFENVTMSEFIYNIPEWDLDADSFAKIEVI